MIVVGYIYNKNGMATWCIEAALALQSVGEEVILVKSKEVQVPAGFPVPIIDYDSNNKRSIFKKIVGKFEKYYQLLPFVKMPGDQFLNGLHQHLLKQGISPNYYFLNQTSFASSLVMVPQYVVAWSYGPFLKQYIKKALLLTENLKSFHDNLYFALYWHKADWIGYRKAKGVFAVSERLKNDLNKSKIAAYTAHPGTNVTSEKTVTNTKDANGQVKFAVMALDLDDKRKGLRKIIEVLKTLSPFQFELVLVGGCSDSFKKWVLADNFPASFTGLLSREKGVEVLNDCDVLLFGSLVDDWGYVQVEAMARGMAVLSPNASPFDEIIGREDYMYDASSKTDLTNKLVRIISRTDKVNEDKIWFKNRYESMFTSEAFGKQLMQVVEKKLASSINHF